MMIRPDDERPAPLRVAVVTPYYRTPPEWLLQCHASVAAQSYPCTHLVVADGQPVAALDGKPVQHVLLPQCHADYGDTPRAIGTISAASQGFDAVAYLDADNWYGPDHVASLVEAHRETGAAVVTSGRHLHRLDGTPLGPCPHVDGEHFVDTNCLFLVRSAFHVATVWWAMPREYHPIGDRIVWGAIRAGGLACAHTGRATVAYRTAFRSHYRLFGEAPPPGARDAEDIRQALRLAEERAREAGPVPHA